MFGFLKKGNYRYVVMVQYYTKDGILNGMPFPKSVWRSKDHASHEMHRAASYGLIFCPESYDNNATLHPMLETGKFDKMPSVMLMYAENSQPIKRYYVKRVSLFESIQLTREINSLSYERR